MSEQEASAKTPRHQYRSRKHPNKPSAEREQKKTSRIQTLGLGAGETIKEKQVSSCFQMIYYIIASTWYSNFRLSVK